MSTARRHSECLLVCRFYRGMVQAKKGPNGYPSEVGSGPVDFEYLKNKGYAVHVRYCNETILIVRLKSSGARRFLT